MKILARILAFPIAIVFSGLGALGLMLHYAGDSEIADQTRRGMQGLNRWLIDQGHDLPRDAAVTTEDWIAGSLLRFVLLPVGLVALSVTLGLLGGGETEAKPKKKSKSGASADAEEEEDEATDKRLVKKAHKQAKSLMKQGSFAEAGDLLWDNGLLDEAVDAFVKGEEFVRAAEIRHDQNRFVDSAELHLQGENFEAAGSIFGQQKSGKVPPTVI